MTLRQSRAVVVGGGFSGLVAARALSEFYENVLVLERDQEPLGLSGRAGTPQDQHVHVLLCGGVNALADLFPGIEHDLVVAGAVSLSEGLDFAQEMPGYDPFPQRDLGLNTYGATRPLIEQVVRKRVAAIPSVEILYGERVHKIETDGKKVAGVLSQGVDDSIRRYEADLIVDASGRAAPTLELISRSGYTPPVQQTAHVGLGYATATFATPVSSPSKWKGVRTLPSDKSLPAGLLLPIQDSRWMLTLATSNLDALPADSHEFMALLGELRTTTIADALGDARPLGQVKRFIFKEASWRRFSDVEHLPSGLLLMGDAICRLNPFLGQGMTIAAIEGRILLEKTQALRDRLFPEADLGREFAESIATFLSAPWQFSAGSAQSSGEQSTALQQRRHFLAAVRNLAARDADIHRLMVEVTGLLKPISSFFEPSLMQRVQHELAAASASGHA